MPKNSPAGLIIGAFMLFFGFGFVWHIWWLVVGSFIGFVVTLIVRTSRDESEIYYYIPAEEARRHDEEHAERLKKLAASQQA